MADSVQDDFSSEERVPLVNAKQTTESPLKTIIIVVLALLLLAAIIAIIVMAILLPKDKDSPTNPSTGGVFSDRNVFPLNPPQPWNFTYDYSRKLQIDTNEGTWMALALSPGFNSEILFDMLGDIFVMPITGGVATPIKTGPAMQVMPAFSPNTGKWVAYASDESGCTNIRIFERANLTNDWALTDDKYRYIHSPTFLNDFTELVAVKWVTAGTRSIAGGEIWIYDVDVEGHTVSSGRLMIDKNSPVAQVGPEEPHHQLDTHFLFYSKNIADSIYWNYNKDVHKGIYNIFRRDTTTNQTITVTGGSGGAARPVISHNGSTLAFIRRTEYKTSLFVRDMVSGNERVLYDDLSWDMQGCFAPSGVYPKFEFTQDDENIFIWSKGKIIEINISSGVVIDIPFNISYEIDLAPTVRAKPSVDTGSQFTAKVASAPSLYAHDDGQHSVLFTSIATTYLLEPNNSVSVPLVTPEPETFYSSPCWSSNGEFAAHVVWTDADLGSIVVTRLSDGDNITVTSKGRYSEIIFSPDDEHIYFRRQGGSSLTGYTYPSNPGLYVADFDAEEFTIENVRMLSSSGYSGLHFVGDNLHGFSGGYPSVRVSSINSGGTSRTVGQSNYATEMKISKDGRYMAFIEFFQVYIVPYSEDTEIFSARPGHSPAGVQRVSVDGGRFLGWTQEGGTSYLSWALGQNLFIIDVDAARTCENEGEECIKSITQVLDLGVVVNTNMPTTTYVIRGGTIYTMNGEETIVNGTIIVTGDTIVTVGDNTVPDPQPPFQEINLNGGYVLPGFIDAHAHFSGSMTPNVVTNWGLALNLAFGVTTVHNPSADSVSVFSDAELVKSGKKIGPRMFSTGTIIYGAGGPGHCDISNLEAAMAHLRRLKAYGAWSVKSYQQSCRAARIHILQAAKNLNMSVVPEGGMQYYWDLSFIVDGHTTIEHNIPMAPLYNDVLTLYSASGTAYTPTFVVNFGDLQGEHWYYQHTNIWENSRLMYWAPQSSIRSQTMRPPQAAQEDYYHFKTTAAAKDLIRRGTKVNTGAHGQMQGLGFHWELGLFKQGNLTNFETLMAGTIFPAESLGMDEQLGTIQPGKLADLITFDAEHDPVADINNAQSVQYVFKDGIVYDALTLAQLYPTQKPGPKPPELNPSCNGCGSTQ